LASSPGVHHEAPVWVCGAGRSGTRRAGARLAFPGAFAGQAVRLEGRVEKAVRPLKFAQKHAPALTVIALTAINSIAAWKLHRSTAAATGRQHKHANDKHQPAPSPKRKLPLPELIAALRLTRSSPVPFALDRLRTRLAQHGGRHQSQHAQLLHITLICALELHRLGWYHGLTEIHRQARRSSQKHGLRWLTEDIGTGSSRSWPTELGFGGDWWVNGDCVPKECVMNQTRPKSSNKLVVALLAWPASGRAVQACSSLSHTLSMSEFRNVLGKSA